MAVRVGFHKFLLEFLIEASFTHSAHEKGEKTQQYRYSVLLVLVRSEMIKVPEDGVLVHFRSEDLSVVVYCTLCTKLG